MKPIAISTCLTLAALSLFAAEAQTSNDPDNPPLHVEKLLSSPQTAGFGDSPLVRAAKATNRIGKRPGQVITNDSLVRQGGHFTTTTTAAQVPLPTPKVTSPTADETAAQTRRDRLKKIAAAEQAKKLQMQKKEAQARAAARDEGDSPEAIYADAPATAGPVEVMKPSTPQTMGQQKPPL